MTTARNWFALLSDGPDRDFCLSFLPAHIMTLSPRQREAIARRFAYRHVFSGHDDGIHTDSGLETLRIWKDRASENCGLGPLTLCGHMAAAYIALCAAVGIYARLVAAIGPHGPDNQAEYWDEEQQAWVFVNVGVNAHWTHRKTAARLNYRELTSLARAGEDDNCVISSLSGGAIHPEGDQYGDWTKWKHDAVISNGNAVYINQPHDWKLWRVWPPEDKKATIWAKRYLVENPEMRLLYPDMSQLITTN